MERISLSAVARSAIGKNAVKKIRREGFVPAVLYGRARDPLVLSVGRKALLGALASGRNVLIDLKVASDGQDLSNTVMITEVQQDHLRREILHVDLHQISLTERLEVDVPVVLAGTAEGVASGGGILEQHLREVTVWCLPSQIPDRLTVNVTALKIGDSLHVRDLAVAEGVEILTPPEEVLASVVAPREEEAEAPAAAAEGEVAAQPELVGQPEASEEGEAKPEAAAAKPAKAEKKE